MSLSKIALWLWLVGCCAFCGDAVLYLTEGLSLHASMYFVGSFTFFMGCVLWLVDLQAAEYNNCPKKSVIEIVENV